MTRFVLCAVTLACIGHGAAAMAQVTVSAQSASISGASGKIVASRVPVQIGSGAPSYFDVTINLAGLMSGGAVTGVKVTGSSTPSQALAVAGFAAGTYIDASGNLYAVTGPGANVGGATAWSVTANKTNACVLASATWYTATGAANPEYARVTKAKINPDNGYSFGVAGGTYNCGGAISNDYQAGALIGVMAAGNSVVISSYTDNTVDSSTPVDTFTLVLQP